MRRAASGLLVPPAGGGPDAPPAISWHTAAWASDPDWTDPGDGNAVSSWRDFSGNGRTFTQATGANQPTFRSSSVNGFPAIDFNGMRWLDTGAFAANVGISVDVFMVAFLPATTDVVFMDRSGGTNGRAFLGTDGADTDLRMFNGTSVSSATVSPGANATLYANFNGSASDLLLNGTSIITNQNCGNAGCGGVRLGADQSGARSSSVRIAFFGLYAGQLTTTELDNLQAWAESAYATP